MLRTGGLRVAVMTWAIFCTAGTASAFYPDATPNYGVGGRTCSTCHFTEVGGSGCGSPPCLNVFGNAFNANGRVWNFTLANGDADGDGFTNGVELLDRWGQWDIGDPAPGPATYVTNPAGYNTTMSECAIGTVIVDGFSYAYNNCSPNAFCSETSGQPGFTCTCSPGYSGNGVSCSDINECMTNPTRCGMGACVNSIGSFSCNCDPGYYFNGVTCSQDACVTNIDDCNSANATCTPNPASPTTQWTCGCAPGFTGAYASQTCVWWWLDLCLQWQFSNWTCTNVDECTSGSAGCPSASACVDTSGSFTCRPCGANAHVVGAVNAESCVCDTNHHGDPYAGCVDDDECTLGTDNCAADAICTNTPGSFTCACAPGFAGNGLVCTDIDECVLGTDDCSVNATCTNAPPGRFTCTCDPAFVGNGVICADVNECTNGTSTCGANETCQNVYGGPHTCTCLPGYARVTPDGPCTSSCGNGLRALREACDDGNVVDGDGCSTTCEIEDGFACYEPMGTVSTCAPTCGDALIDPPLEECDDGPSNSDVAPNACRTTCEFAHCGDGILDADETCDTGDDVSDTALDACRTTCVPAFCGDGVVDTGERCDPGGGDALAASICQRARCATTADGGTGGTAGGSCGVAGVRGRGLAGLVGFFLFAFAFVARRRAPGSVIARRARAAVRCTPTRRAPRG